MALRTDQTTFDVLKRGFRSGWQQNPAVEVPEVAAMTENEQRLLSQVDDIWHEMNRRANKKQPKAEPVAQGSSCPKRSAASRTCAFRGRGLEGSPLNP